MTPPPREVTATLTLADVLGAMSRPLAATLANWVKAPECRRRMVRRCMPDLAQALDDLVAATESKIGSL